MIIDKHDFKPREVSLPQNPTMGELAAQSACFFDTSSKSLPTTPRRIFFQIRRKGNNNNNDKKKRSYYQAFPAHENRSRDFRAHEPQKDQDNISPKDMDSSSPRFRFVSIRKRKRDDNEKKKRSYFQAFPAPDAHEPQKDGGNTSPKDMDSLSSRFRFVSIRKKKRDRSKKRKSPDRDDWKSNPQKENLAPQLDNITKSGFLWDDDSEMSHYCVGQGGVPIEKVNNSKKPPERERNRRHPCTPFHNPNKRQALFSAKNGQENEAARIMTGIISGTAPDPKHNDDPDCMEWSSDRDAASVRIQSKESSSSDDENEQEEDNSMCHLYKNCYCDKCFHVELEWETRKECSMVRNSESITRKNSVWQNHRKWHPHKQLQQQK